MTRGRIDEEVVTKSERERLPEDVAAALKDIERLTRAPNPFQDTPPENIALWMADAHARVVALQARLRALPGEDETHRPRLTPEDVYVLRRDPDNRIGECHCGRAWADHDVHYPEVRAGEGEEPRPLHDPACLDCDDFIDEHRERAEEPRAPQPDLAECPECGRAPRFAVAAHRRDCTMAWAFGDERAEEPRAPQPDLRAALAEDAALLHHYVHPDVSFEDCDGARCVRRRAALRATPVPASGLPSRDALADLGLSDEQTAILRGHLASRQQTVAEFFGDVLMDYGLGRATGKEYPPPATLAGEETTP